MPVLLPVSSVKEQFTVQLDTWLVTLDVYFNDRSQLWMFDMIDATTGAFMLSGAPFVLGEDLLAPYIFGIGSLFVVDTSQRHIEATPDDFGTRVVVLYYTPAEVAAHTAA